MKRTISVLAAAAAFTLVGCASDTGASASASGPSVVPASAPANDFERQEAERAWLLLQYDANQDNTVSRAEFEAGAMAEFAAADLDGDGKLNGAERRAANEQRAQFGQSSPLMDWNADSFVDFKEFTNVPANMFAQLDRNGDGEVSEGEFCAIRIEAAHRRRGPRLMPTTPGAGSVPRGTTSDRILGSGL